MTHFRLYCLTIGIMVLCHSHGYSQGLNVPAPSPTQTIHQNFALSYIDISYSRPAVKGRKVFGDLVPFGQVWRTGANASTKISFGEDVKVGDHLVASGKYALYTIPGPQIWTIILSKDTTLDGAFGYKADNDLLRFQVPSHHLSSPVESFTINIMDLEPNRANVELMWENTAVDFPVTADIDSTIMANIDVAMQGNQKPYYAAASYYFDNHKDIHKALEWINAGTAENPKAYYMFYLKARILAKLGNKQQAIDFANQSIALAKQAGNPDYVRLNEKLIRSLGNSK